MHWLFWEEFRKLFSRSFLGFALLLLILVPLFVAYGPWQSDLKSEQQLFFAYSNLQGDPLDSPLTAPFSDQVQGFETHWRIRQGVEGQLEKRLHQLQAKREMSLFNSPYQSRVQDREEAYLTQLLRSDFQLLDDTGWRRLFECPWLLVAQFLFGMVLLERLFLEERHLDVNRLLDTYPLGRRGLFLRRFAVFTLLFALFSTALYGIFALLIRRSSPFLNFPAQLLTGYENFILPITVGDLFRLQEGLLFCAFLIFYLILLFFFFKVKGIAIPLLLSAGTVIAGSGLYRLILPHSHFALLRYLNPALPLFISKELQQTFFIPLLNHPVSNVELMGGCLGSGIILLFLLDLWIWPEEALSANFHRTQRGKSKVLNLWQADLSVVWKSRYILLCLIFLTLFLGGEALRFQRTEDLSESILLPFYQEYEGSMNEQKRAKLALRAEQARQQIQQVNQLNHQIRELLSSLKDEDKSSMERDQLDQQIRLLNKEKSDLEQQDPDARGFLFFYEQVGDKIQGGAPALYYSEGQERLWGVTNGFYPNQRYGVCALFLIILLCQGFAPEHEETGAALIRTLPEGRKTLLRLRFLQIGAGLMIVYLLTFIIQYKKLGRFFPMTGWRADLFSLLGIACSLPLWVSALLNGLVVLGVLFLSAIGLFGVLLWGGRIRCLALGILYFAIPWILSKLGLGRWSILSLFGLKSMADPLEVGLLIGFTVLVGVAGVWYLNKKWIEND